MLTPHEQGSLLGLFAGRKEDSSASPAFFRLQTDQFQCIADWYHFAILSLLETKDASSNIGWIAKRLRISRREAIGAVERMLRLGLLTKTIDGKLRLTRTSYTTSDEVTNTAVRKNHSQILERARESLESDEIGMRDSTSMMMAINTERLPEAKKLIREFRDKLSAFLEGGKQKEVYALAVNLIPITTKGRTR